MSYCPATTSITILSLYNFCLQSNKLLLNSLHSLEICSTSVCVKHCLEMLSTQIFHTRYPGVGANSSAHTDSHCWLRHHRWQKPRTTWEPPFLTMWSQLPSSALCLHRNGHMNPPTHLLVESNQGAGRTPRNTPFLAPHSVGKETILCVFSGASPGKQVLNEWMNGHLTMVHKQTGNYFH